MWYRHNMDENMIYRNIYIYIYIHIYIYVYMVLLHGRCVSGATRHDGSLRV